MDEEKLKTQVVPWKNPAEFIKVYKCAYSDDLSKNRWAVEQIAVWETRCWPSLPTAVDATLLFVRSKIQDRLYEANKSLCQAQEIEMLYGISVVRFVNLLVEFDQNGKVKKRMSSLAAERNIPPWIVEIRHQATHGHHPTLPVLRMAHDTVMAYLEDIFWRPESSRVCCIKRTLDEAPMVELWKDYRVKLFQVVVHQVQAKPMFETAVNEILKRMNFLLNKPSLRKPFLKVIARDFFTEEEIPLVEDDQGLMDPDMLGSLILPKPLQEFYTPLIHFLHKNDLISVFLEQLLLGQEFQRLKVSQIIVDLTVVFVLTLVQGEAGTDKDANRPFIRRGVNLNVYRLLYSSVRGCSGSARIVLERLMKDSKLTLWSEELSVMMSIRQGKYLEHHAQGGASSQGRKRRFDMTFTAENLEEDIQEMMGANNSVSKKNPWSYAPLGIDWASIPLGHVFNPVDRTAKEESTDEVEAIPAENCENIHDYACEESKPVKETPLEKFIFSEEPDFSSMIYS